MEQHCDTGPAPFSNQHIEIQEFSMCATIKNKKPEKWQETKSKIPAAFHKRGWKERRITNYR